MRKFLFLLSFLVAFGYNGYSQEMSSKIDEDLQKEMSLRNSDEFISVNIILEAQYDQSLMRQKSDAYTSKAAKRDFVVGELKSFSEATQINLMDLLKSLEKNSSVKEIKSHWLCNVINCQASRDAINEIASSADVLIIGYNEMKHYLFEDEVGTPAEGGTREITQNIIQVNADDVWAAGYTGEGVVVAVVDTGVNYNHQDLADHLWDGGPEFPYHGYDCVNNDNNPMDDHGHGSHCSGTVCGDGTAGSQTGMAPDATLMCVKVLNSSGNGSIDAICGGVEFAVEHGADLFSMSLGFAGGGTQAERVQYRTVMVNTLEAGVPGIIASGNEKQSLWNYPVPNNVRVPGNCPPPWLHPDQTVQGGLSCVISIGAVDYNDQEAYFTSQGPVTWQSVPGFNDYPYNPGIGLIRPDVSAPGVDIKSLNYSGNSGYTTMSGTSMATPCTAGVVCLLLSKNGDLTPAEIDEILETTAVKLTPTKSNAVGSGRIDALAAIEEVVNGPIMFGSCAINDAQGNNNGKFNPGETVGFNMTMMNIAEFPVHDASLVLTSDNPYITIVDSVAQFGTFEIGENKTINDAFMVALADNAPIGENLKFTVKCYSDTNFCKNNFKVLSYDYTLDFSKVSIYDVVHGNSNGMLDPGETADLVVDITNFGNQEALGIVGHLVTTSEYLTINTNDIVYGTIGPDGETKFAQFNVTLSESVPSYNTVLPLSLTLTDNYGRTTEETFEYVNRCKVLFTLKDSGSNGWEGASLKVHFDDGTPTRTLTVPDGVSQIVVPIDINYTTTCHLTWVCGINDNDCSIDIDYESGVHIYSTCCSHAGIFFTWYNDCAGSITQICDAPTNLEATVVRFDVILDWTAPASDGVAGYDVYRGTQKIATVAATTYTDADLEEGVYTYSVEAVYESGCISDPTEEISVEVVYMPLLGDANGDNAVNISDITVTISYMLDENPKTFIFENADVNTDGLIDIRDIFRMVAIIIENK